MALLRSQCADPGAGRPHQHGRPRVPRGQRPALFHAFHRNGHRLNYTCPGVSSRWPTQIDDGLGRPLDLAYTSDRVVSVTDHTGRSIAILYWANNPAPRRITDAAGGETQSFTFHKVSLVVYPDGGTEGFAYDERGNLLAHANQEGGVTRYAYDARGWATNIVNAAGGAVTLTWLTNGVIARRSDADTGTTTYEYDALLRMTNVVFADGTTKK